jgi:hypothetical protein
MIAGPSGARGLLALAAASLLIGVPTLGHAQYQVVGNFCTITNSADGFYATSKTTNYECDWGFLPGTSAPNEWVHVITGGYNAATGMQTSYIAPVWLVEYTGSGTPPSLTSAYLSLDETYGCHLGAKVLTGSNLGGVVLQCLPNSGLGTVAGAVPLAFTLGGSWTDTITTIVAEEATPPPGGFNDTTSYADACWETVSDEIGAYALEGPLGGPGWFVCPDDGPCPGQWVIYVSPNTLTVDYGFSLSCTGTISGTATAYYAAMAKARLISVNGYTVGTAFTDNGDLSDLPLP